MLPAVSLALLSLAAPTAGQARSAASLDTLFVDFVAALNAKDFTRLPALYAEDGVWMPPNAPMITGRAAIEAVFRTRFATECSRSLP